MSYHEQAGPSVELDRDIFFDQSEMLANMANLLARSDAQLEGREDDIPSRGTEADNVVEARLDCSLTFLEEGLLPAIRDREMDIFPNEILEMAEHFVEVFARNHPNDFDIPTARDLLQATSLNFLPLQIAYKTRGEENEEYLEVLELINKADFLIGNIIEVGFG